ncbi:WD40 repeat-like protein [Mycena chlorophos]|uniref:Pre-rRNA-processing protein IPI3 n=1 Tax=Mycena chlorophos TaxID=658473 RepID=A0A8H6WMY4_MYCCL|nr:WD40 repeat-like protein [Mycena chlorophos]
MRETIICTSTPTGASGAIAIHDLQTGATLASFKQTTSALHSTAIVQTQGALGGLLFAVQQDKPILNLYNFQKDQINSKTVLPEKLSCIAVDHAGEYLAGGTLQGRIYIWELSSGILFNAWDAHYRKITVLKFSNDGSALLSGSEDSGVSVWSVPRLLDDDTQTEPPAPYCVLSDHTLPVTDILCGVGIFPRCRILSASLDHSVKLWDLASHSLLTTFQFPHPLTCLAWDPTERVFFAASPNGSVHQVNLFKSRDVPGSYSAVGGAGAADIIRVDDEERDKAQKRRLISVGEPVLSLAISLTCTLLLVGTSAGSIHVFDIPSHQLLRSISTHKGTSINHLATMLKPPDLVGHVSLSLQNGSPSDSGPILPRSLPPLQRMRDAKSREVHDITVMLPHRPAHQDESASFSAEDLLREHAFFTTQHSSEHQDSTSLQSRVNELESEVVSLREQLGKAKGLNDVMWETYVHKVLGKEREEPEPERRRKRGRTDS